MSGLALVVIHVPAGSASYVILALILLLSLNFAIMLGVMASLMVFLHKASTPTVLM